jgi:fatty acid desaturase
MSGVEAMSKPRFVLFAAVYALAGATLGSLTQVPPLLPLLAMVALACLGAVLMTRDNRRALREAARLEQEVLDRLRDHGDEVDPFGR